MLASTVFSWFSVCCVWCTVLLNFHYVELFTGIESSCLYSLFVFTVYNHCLYMWCGMCVVLSGGFLHCCVSVVTRVGSCPVLCW